MKARKSTTNTGGGTKGETRKGHAGNEWKKNTRANKTLGREINESARHKNTVEGIKERSGGNVESGSEQWAREPTKEQEQQKIDTEGRIKVKEDEGNNETNPGTEEWKKHYEKN